MPPIGRHLGERDEHESAILHPRMWQDQPIGRLNLLTHGIKRKPMFKNLPVRQHLIPGGDQIKIQRPRAPTRFSLPSMGGFNIVQNRQNFGRSLVRP